VPRRTRQQLGRRDLLKGATALGAWALAGCGGSAPYPSDLEEAPLSPSFPLGCASGDVDDRSAILWTRYLGGRELTLTVALVGPSGEVLETVHVRRIEVEDGGFVHATVEGLSTGTGYAYRFSEGGSDAAAIEGRFRTAPQAGTAGPMIFSASACSRNGMTFGALLQGAARPADLHLLLGDTTYNDGCRTLGDFRSRWSENLSTGAYRTLRASRSVLATWDDHEVANDWSGDDTDPELIENGKASFFEHTPMRRGRTEPDRIWRTLRWGETAEFFVLDGRSERRPSTRGTSSAEYLSTAQLEWLKESLAASTARFKVIMNSVPITDFPGFLAGWARDRWTAYEAQRESLLNFIEERPVRGAFFVSGDFHMASMGRIAQAGVGASLTEVLAGPVASSGNPAWVQCRAPQFDFASDTSNTTFFDLQPATGEVRVKWIGSTGVVLGDRTFAV
jgi:alkaline phosphatase D